MRQYLQRLWPSLQQSQLALSSLELPLALALSPGGWVLALPEGSRGPESFLGHPSGLTLDMRNHVQRMGPLLTKLAVCSVALAQDSDHQPHVTSYLNYQKQFLSHSICMTGAQVPLVARAPHMTGQGLAFPSKPTVVLDRTLPLGFKTPPAVLISRQGGVSCSRS